MTSEDYERHFREHDDFWRNNPTLYFTTPLFFGFMERMNWIVANAKGDVLDCGCNDGTYTEALRKRGHKAVGVDILPRNIGLAKAMYPQNEFYIMDVEKLEFEDESFDTVVFTETIEHLIDPRKGLREIHRVMRKGGRLLCCTTYIAGEPTHYQDYHDRDVVLRLIEEFFAIDRVTIGDSGCVQVVATRKES